MGEMTEGRQMLIRVLQITRGREVAARCRVSPSQVSKWLGGFTRPSTAARRALEDNYRIPSDSWNRYVQR